MLPHVGLDTGVLDSQMLPKPVGGEFFEAMPGHSCGFAFPQVQFLNTAVIKPVHQSRKIAFDFGLGESKIYDDATQKGRFFLDSLVQGV